MPTDYKLHGHSQKRAQYLSWTEKMRMTLHCMHTDFTLNADTRLCLFSTIFADHISACGVTSITTGSLAAQYTGRNYTSRAHNWQDVLKVPDAAKELAERQEVRALVSSALQELGIRSSTSLPSVPQTPQPAVSTKRKRCTLYASSSAPEDNDVFSTTNTRSTKTLRSLHSVVIPRPASRTPKHTVRTMQLPKTPQRDSPAAQNASNSRTKTLVRQIGPSLELSFEEYKKATEKYAPPSEADAQPAILPTLFFRFWDTVSQGDNSSSGFESGLGLDTNIQEHPPTVAGVRGGDVFRHINGSHNSASPFLSVSDNFAWALRHACKKYKEGRKGINMSIISSQALDPKTVFYARPFICILRERKSFTEGKQRYWGSNEWLIWEKIPEEAMVATVSLRDYMEKINSMPAGELVCLDMISKRRSPIKIRQDLKDRDKRLDCALASTIAELVLTLGLDATSDLDQLAYLVAEIVAGFAVSVRFHDLNHWLQLASSFAHSFVLASLTPVDIGDQAKLKMAFILGVHSNLADVSIKDFNVRNSPTNKRKHQRKVIAAGLEEGAKIITNELDAAKLHILVCQTKHQQLFGTAPSRLNVANNIITDDGEAEDCETRSQFEMDEDRPVLQ